MEKEIEELVHAVIHLCLVLPRVCHNCMYFHAEEIKKLGELAINIQVGSRIKEVMEEVDRRGDDG